MTYHRLAVSLEEPERNCMSWTREPIWTGTVHLGCLHCTPKVENAVLCALSRTLAVGFGETTVTKNAEVLYLESDWEYAHGYRDPLGMSDEEFDAVLVDTEEQEGEEEEEDYPTLQRYEALALQDPDHDWRVVFCGALHEEEYQRQGPAVWVLIRSGQGFA